MDAGIYTLEVRYFIPVSLTCLSEVFVCVLWEQKNGEKRYKSIKDKRETYHKVIAWVTNKDNRE